VIQKCDEFAFFQQDAVIFGGLYDKEQTGAAA
jgi:hypothetical protein